MSSKAENRPDKTGAKLAAKRGELGAGELDKVVGGMKPIGVAAPKKPSSFSGDPCEGGE